MKFTGFKNEDFNVFNIDGLDERMEALKLTIRPKLEALGQHFAPTLSTLTGEEMFFHVAKHARRTINPPKDTWVAIGNSNRGYKMLPHFQIGLWETHVFIWFAVIYESPIKEAFGEKLKLDINYIEEIIPEHFVWSGDHTKPGAIEHEKMNIGELSEMFERVMGVKKAEILCGLHLGKEKVLNMKAEDVISTIDDTFRKLLPLYQLAQQSSK